MQTQKKLAPALLAVVLFLSPALAPASPAPGRDAWSHETLGAVHARPLVGSDGRVVVGGEDGFAHAFEAGGRLLWSYKASDGFTGWPAQAGPNHLALANRNGQLYILEMDGDLKKKVDLGGVAPGPPAQHRGRLFFVLDRGKLVAVERGSVAWVYPGSGAGSSAYPAVDSDGGVYMGLDDGAVVALSRNGKPRWRVVVSSTAAPKSGSKTKPNEKDTSPAPGAVLGAMAITGGNGKDAQLVFATAGGEVIALSRRDGKEVWRQRAGVAQGGLASLGGGVVLGTQAGLIKALDGQGKVRWELQADGPARGTPTVSGGKVLVGTDGGTLYLLSSAGAPLALYPAGGAVRGAARVARGRILFGSADRRLRVEPLPARQRTRWQVSSALKARLSETPRGRLLWRTPLSGPVARGVGPARRGKILAATWGRKIYLLEPDGKVSWSYNCGEDVNTLPAMGKRGEVVFGCGDGGFYGLGSDGEMAYRFPVNKLLSSSPALARDSTVYFGARDKRVYALDSLGKLRWRVLTGDDVDSAPRIGPDGMVYVGSDDRHLYAIDPQGRILWYVRVGGAVRSRPAMARGKNSPIYFTAMDQRLHSVDQERGVKRWSFQTAGQLVSSPVVGADGTIFFGSRDHNLYAVSPAGKLRWRQSTAGEVDATPALVGPKGEHIAVGSDDGNLYVYSAADGKLLWWYPAGAQVRGGLVGRKDGGVILGAMDGAILAVAPPGPEGQSIKAPAKALASKGVRRLGRQRVGPLLPRSDGGFVVAGADGVVRAMGGDGWPAWTLGVGRERLGALAQHGDDLYFSDNRGSLLCLRGGRLRFRLRLDRLPLTDPAVLNSAAGTRILVGSAEGRVWAVTPQGRVAWFYAGANAVSRAPVALGNQLALAVMGNEVVGVDPSGNELWSRKLPAGVVAGPVAWADGAALADGLGGLHLINPAGIVTWKRDLGAPALDLRASLDGSTIWAATTAGRILAHARDGQPLMSLNPPASPTRLVPLDSGALLVAFRGGGLSLLDNRRGTTRRVGEVAGQVLDAHPLPGGRVLLATDDGEVVTVTIVDKK